MKTIKMSSLIEIRKNTYQIIQLIPTKSNKNNNTEQIAVLINKMYKQINKMIHKVNKSIIIEQQNKVLFYIHITNEKIQFYFMIPKFFYNQFKTKIREIWKNVEIKEEISLPLYLKGTKYSLEYMMNDSLSLAVDKRNNDLLNANLSIVEALNEDEELGILYNFIPTNERERNYFKNNVYKKSIKNFKNGETLKKRKNTKDYSLIVITNLINFINDLVESFLNKPKSDRLTINPTNKQISYSTQRKAEKDICKNQTIILSKSSTKEREKQLCTMLYNSFLIINDDNKLIPKEIKKVIDIKRPIINNVPINKCSIEECSNFMALPSKESMEQFGMIEHNKVLEKTAPKCLQKGDIRIGLIKNKGVKEEVFYSRDSQIKRLGRVLLGSQGSGKTHYMMNLAKDIIKSNRGLVVIDYIDKCQLSEKIKEVVPKDKLIEINFNNPNELQSFNYNELRFDKDDEIYYKISIAMQKAEQLQILLDSINNEFAKLTPRMLRYFYSACTIVYYLDCDASFKDIINVLKRPSEREYKINKLSKEEKELLNEEIDDLIDLDKEGKNGVENYDSKVDGILDRISYLRINLFTKIAFSKRGNENIDFVKELNQNKVILVRIPEYAFRSRTLRNVIATFFLNKVWLAKQSDSSTQTELFFDEIHQCYNCQLIMQDILVECRKFNLTPTLSMHYLGQLTNKCKDSVIASGCSYILIQGSPKEAFLELKIYFEKDGYTEVDLAELERFNALCLIKNEETNYSSFVVKLPA